MVLMLTKERFNYSGDSYGEDTVETDNEADQSADSLEEDKFDDFINVFTIKRPYERSDN